MAKQILSKAELAALDLMIAHLQENNKEQMGDFIESAIVAVQNSANQIGILTNTDAVQIESAAYASITPTVAAAAMTGTIHASPAEINALIQKLGSDDLKSKLTLSNLMKIRNQYSK
jgi:signal-transduction protein with cAMP-binding, CBS, and nucleotidyltransferase domain